MIDKIGRAYGINSVSQVHKSSKAANSTKKEGTDSGDGLEVSSFGQEMSRAMTELRKVPEVRQSKVESIRSQVEAGTYKPDMNTLAAKLIEIGITREND